MEEMLFKMSPKILGRSIKEVKKKTYHCTTRKKYYRKKEYYQFHLRKWKWRNVTLWFNRFTFRGTRGICGTQSSYRCWGWVNLCLSWGQLVLRDNKILMVQAVNKCHKTMRITIVLKRLQEIRKLTITCVL